MSNPAKVLGEALARGEVVEEIHGAEVVAGDPVELNILDQDMKGMKSRNV